MRPVARLAVSIAVLLASACSQSSKSGADAPRTYTDVTTSGATVDPGTAAATCPGGTSACGQSGWCCPTGTECAANPSNTLGCGTGYCCLGCTTGTACGGGCCASGTSCTANPGGTTGCSTSFCCSPEPDPTSCPADVAAQCPGGTQCLENHSARYCPGGFACYAPSGVIACPGEVACPNGVDFCPSGTACAGLTGGVCPQSSSSGNYCCETPAQLGQSCDTAPCADGLTCLPNPHCADSDPTAAYTCHGACGGWTDCGNYCCPPDYPYCYAGYACGCST